MASTLSNCLDQCSSLESSQSISETAVYHKTLSVDCWSNAAENLWCTTITRNWFWSISKQHFCHLNQLNRFLKRLSCCKSTSRSLKSNILSPKLCRRKTFAPKAIRITHKSIRVLAIYMSWSLLNVSPFIVISWNFCRKLEGSRDENRITIHGRASCRQLSSPLRTLMCENKVFFRN